MSRNAWYAAIAAATLLLAGVLSYFAYAPPDALEHSLERYGEEVPTADAAQEEAGGYAGVLPDYSVPGVESPFATGGLAGMVGALLTFLVIAGTTLLLRTGSRRTAHVDGPPSVSEGPPGTGTAPGTGTGMG